MSIFSTLRQRALSRWLGDGLSGAVGAAALGWGWSKLREGVRKDPEVLDISTLQPGETYTLVTRPAPKRAERKLEAKEAKTAKRLAKAGRRRTSRRRARAVKEIQLTRALAAIRAELEAERAASLAKATKKRRPPRRREFR